MASTQVLAQKPESITVGLMLWKKAVQLVESDSANEQRLQKFRAAIEQETQLNRLDELTVSGTPSNALPEQ